MVSRLATIAAAFTTLASAPLAAKDTPAPPPTSYEAVAACRAIADAGQRLACFDRSVGTFAAAVEQREVVIADKAAVKEARRGLFGLSLPSLKLFGGGDGDEEVSEIQSTIAGTGYASDGKALITLADGARWKQIEGRRALQPKAGTAIRIRRGAMGGYIAEVKGYAWTRVKRLAD
jgi:hypothetical protein